MHRHEPVEPTHEQPVLIDVGGDAIHGDLGLPDDPLGLVVFCHGSGSSRHSPRNRAVAAALRETGFSTLLLDLLAPDEDAIDEQTGQLRFDIDLLSLRVVRTLDWLAHQRPLRAMPIGLFGASTGAAAALVAAAARPYRVQAVVSRGGRPDLAGTALQHVRAPTLLLVGGADVPCLGLNRQAFAALVVRDKELRVVPRASHLFTEPGALETVAHLAAQWFARHLAVHHSAAHHPAVQP